MRRVVLRVLVALGAIGAFQLVGVPTAWSAPETRLTVLKGAGEHGIGFPATHLAVRWEGSEDAVVQLRWPGAREWQDVAASHDLSDDEAGVFFSGMVRVEGVRQAETRVVSGGARNVALVAIDAEHGPRRLTAAPALPKAGASIANAAVGNPPVITRAEWGADESKRKGSPSFAPLKKLIVHHTDTANDDPNPAATVRAVYAFHTDVRGWSDIGYNFLVDAQGRVYEGRWARDYAPGEVHNGENSTGRGVIGAHAEGANTGSVGVSLLGNFTATSPTTAAVNGLQAVLSWKADRHDIDPTGSSDFNGLVNLPNISGHRDTKSTSCPGDVLWGRLPKIRQQVQHIVMSAHGPTPGYWVATKDGNVLNFGAAGALGSMAGKRLNAPIVGMAATTTGKGYWLLGADGGIFSFGDARFFGSTGSMRLNAPVLGMAPTATGGGYWLFARDGGIFSYGNAAFHGSTGSMKLNSPVNGMDKEAAGKGYWLVARDGGVFAFDVPFYGSIPGLGLSSYVGAASMRSTSSGRGYYILATDGWVAAFGDAREHGYKTVAAGTAVDMALVPVPVGSGA